MGQVAKARIPEADVKSVRLFFLHIFDRTAMFIDGAAAAYKSKTPVHLEKKLKEKLA